MSAVYQVGTITAIGLLAAAYWTKDRPDSSSKICLVGAGITAGLLLVCGLFDLKRPDLRKQHALNIIVPAKSNGYVVDDAEFERVWSSIPFRPRYFRRPDGHRI